MGRWRDGTGELSVLDGVGAAVALEIAASYRARTKGLLGRDGIEGAILLTPASSVHTFRMRFAIDVAHLDRELRVIAVRTMRPGRLGALRPRARHVLEAEAGAMAGWGLRPGAQVVIATGQDLRT
ncbi:DUF192 domain-containing protein [Streptomyces sp. NBC_01431]|uniref:DUF192 domain-containing protein n=1 Tax=Streptomyces sp. NBC_01431 TaxID=2903863 RepID=UPI002E2F9CD0|nr:DUF192 domain-containing protein [Streptomyces sp. NBC_01431]